MATYQACPSCHATTHMDDCPVLAAVLEFFTEQVAA